ncbi:MAG: CpsD/CapB family tyrosine-protein kinase [Acidobacteria bacterium]|nr:CpsD/CapB family tyrosine-protein kinase [Acidobacteriota bacterium]
MSIFKALQKRQSEEQQQFTEAEKQAPASVVTFEKAARRVNTTPELFLNDAVKIGAPTTNAAAKNAETATSTALAFNGQKTDSLIGKALPDLELNKTAGATLNAVVAVNPARSASEKHSCDFTVWNVEAERVEPRLVAITEPNSNYCEEYRSLRTQILHKSQREKLQSIVVASVNQSEGKSVTALNLSWMMAQTDGVRALVIDSDLRMPSLSDYLGIETDKGLSDILAGRATLLESIIRLEPAGLHILPGGEARSDVAELLSGPRFKEILREACDMFDYIIIDAPPLGIFTDATVLINQADGAMLVVRAGHTRYASLDRVLEQLPRERMLGVVLNQSEDVLDEANYNYGYYNSSRRIKN